MKQKKLERKIIEIVKTRSITKMKQKKKKKKKNFIKKNQKIWKTVTYKIFLNFSIKKN